MEKNVEITLLYDIYGKLLTDKQAEAIELYYNDDLSLAEIADNTGISRQGVRDNLKRAEAILYDTEDKLGIAQRFLRIRKKTAEINGIINEIEHSQGARIISDDMKRKINKILLIIEEINSDNL